MLSRKKRKKSCSQGRRINHVLKEGRRRNHVVNDEARRKKWTDLFVLAKL